MALATRRKKRPALGRRHHRQASALLGRRVASRRCRAGNPAHPLDVAGTINAALVRRALTAEDQPQPLLDEKDLHQQIRSQKTRRLIVFVLDTSDSMGDGPAVRMSATLGALMALAKSAYLNRDQVCLITFRGHQAEVVIPPTDSVMRVRRRVNRLPVGGATPLAAGLRKALQVIIQARRRTPLLEPLLVLISDGEATIPLKAGSNPERDALEMARQLQISRVPALMIDTLPGHQANRLMPRLAEVMAARCEHIQHLKAHQVLQSIEEHGSP